METGTRGEGKHSSEQKDWCAERERGLCWGQGMGVIGAWVVWGAGGQAGPPTLTVAAAAAAPHTAAGSTRPGPPPP